MIYSKQIERYVSSFDESNCSIGVIEFLDASEAIKTRNVCCNWIAVQERLPTGCGDYLVLLRSTRYRVMNYAHESETFIPRCMNQAVTHWMPLPPIPGL
jgi:uncharacterized protein DUF551